MTDFLGEQRILEIYLNVVEWGPGIYGADAVCHPCHPYHTVDIYGPCISIVASQLFLGFIRILLKARGGAYIESSFPLARQDQLTLVTDGIVEHVTAQVSSTDSAATAALSTQSAEQIALAARFFGQDDDLTVLTPTRTAPSMPSTPAPSPILDRA